MVKIHDAFVPENNGEPFYDRAHNRHSDDPPDSEIERAWIDFCMRAKISSRSENYMKERGMYYRWYKRQARAKAKFEYKRERTIDIPPQMQHLFD